MTAGQVAGWREILAGHARIIGVPEGIVVMTSHRFLNRSVWLPLAAGSPSRPGALF